MATLTLIAAFIAGLISFASPCILPLVPAFLAYLSGATLQEGEEQRKQGNVFLHSVMYVLGFSTIFAVLGILLNSFLSTVAYDVQLWLSRIAGVVIIMFGLFLLGLLRFSFLEQEHILHVKQRFKLGYVNSFLLGAAFAVGWSPCVGAVLGSIYALAVSQPSMSFALLLAYALGLGVPFLIVGLFSEKALAWIEKSRRFLKYFNIVVGIMLIILGILVFTQSLNLIANIGIVNDLLLR
ncbi:sulfite exporter TauE/SafE family protein [Candidatus Woesearchaeota archaeon]|nr:sulfite exporter TauE/SafE family protein [Candidatus Woesearchaeota archaeon]